MDIRKIYATYYLCFKYIVLFSIIFWTSPMPETYQEVFWVGKNEQGQGINAQRESVEYYSTGTKYVGNI